MQLKHKLIYFALGCAFVVIAQVLLSIVVPKVTAQGKKMNFTEEIRKRRTEEYLRPTTPEERLGLREEMRKRGLLEGKKEAVEFDKVRVRSLEVVDDTGKVRAVLEFKKEKKPLPKDEIIDDLVYLWKEGGLIPTGDVIMDDVIQVFNNDGSPVCRIGNSSFGEGIMAVYKNVPYRHPAVIMDTSTGGGRVRVINKDNEHNKGEKYGHLGVEIAAKGGMTTLAIKSEYKTYALIAGGLDVSSIVRISGTDGKPRATMGVNEYGDGVVNTWDKNGYKLR